MEPYRPSKFEMPGYAEFAKSKKNKKKLLIRAGLILIIPIVAILVTTFSLRIYHVEGPSMEPSLKDNQRVLIQKWSKTIAGLKGIKYKPNRYDVVVLIPPDDNTQVIKRIIGVPGDRIITKDDKVIIFNSEHPEGYKVDEEAPVGKMIYFKKTEGFIDITLDTDEYFVLGDNRENSEDSRVFGVISAEDIVGQLWQTL